MAREIAITETYLNSVFKLDSQSKKLTLSTIKQLAADVRSAALQIHGIDRQKCDTKFRSARINDDLRVIFAQQGNTYTLLYVDRHDDAYNWCDGKYLAKTDFGAEYIYDEKVMLTERNVSDVSQHFYVFDKPLLQKAQIKDKHLSKLGVPQIHADNLLMISNEDSYIDYIAIFPAEIQEALLDLATGAKSFDDIYNALTDEEYDQSASQPLTQKDSMRRFYIPQSMDELQKLMENDAFEKWTIFLHPSQEKLVRSNFNGSVLVEGGPGTGKTIVGIHRACHLAEHVYRAQDQKKILFCTFSKKLARVISQKLDSIMHQCGVENNVDVVGVDSFIFHTLSAAHTVVPAVNPAAFSNLLNRLYEELAPKGSKGFYQHEYFEIIERHNIRTLEEYLEVDRTGTGLPLDKKKRTVAWGFLDALLKEKEKQGIYTFADRAYLLLADLESGVIAPQYDSIIIDEAQDLEPVKLRALCQCVRTDVNNVMILSDMNQRIFRLSTWKHDIGVDVVGRSYHLSVNYRTTKQINDYARHQFIRSEMSTAHIREYKSIMNGVEPTVMGFATAAEQLKYIVTKVRECLQNGCSLDHICVVCPTREDCGKIQSIFTYEDIPSTLLFDDVAPSRGSGVCVCPVTGVKGLEFETVIIFDYNNIGKGRINENDSAAIQLNSTKLVECEKYVAATRAREELIITYVQVGN